MSHRFPTEGKLTHNQPSGGPGGTDMVSVEQKRSPGGPTTPALRWVNDSTSKNSGREKPGAQI